VAIVLCNHPNCNKNLQRPDYRYREYAPSMELAFLCDSREAVDEMYNKITAQGYPGYREPWDAFWGQRYAIVQDPDGNLICLFASEDFCGATLNKGQPKRLSLSPLQMSASCSIQKLSGNKATIWRSQKGYCISNIFRLTNSL